MAPERTRVSAISSACSPVSGWLTEQVVDVHADRLGVARIERVLGVDEGDQAPGLLRLGDDVKAHRRLTASLGTVDLDDAAPRQSADAQRQVQRQRARRDDLDVA